MAWLTSKAASEARGSGFARRSAPVFRAQAGGSNKSLTGQRRRTRPAAMAGVRERYRRGLVAGTRSAS